MDEESSPAKKPKTAAQIRIRRKARNSAKEQGLDWKEMSREERQGFMLSAREEMKAARGKPRAARNAPT